MAKMRYIIITSLFLFLISCKEEKLQSDYSSSLPEKNIFILDASSFRDSTWIPSKDDINNIEFVSNPGNDFLKNSGKKAVTFLHSRGVTSVMSGNYGMTVKKMLDKHKIQTIIIPAKYKNLTQLLKILK